MDTLKMFVLGDALSGGPTNYALQGAQFIRSTCTAPRYRFYLVRSKFPSIFPCDIDGVSVSGEVYEVTYEILHKSLLPTEPIELELDVIELEDGSGSLAMRLRSGVLRNDEIVDISEYGGWHSYLQHYAPKAPKPRSST